MFKIGPLRSLSYRNYALLSVPRSSTAASNERPSPFGLALVRTLVQLFA
jgi:hypothetical protein